MNTAGAIVTCPRCEREMPADFAKRYHDLEKCREQADMQPMFAEATVLVRGEAAEGNTFDWLELTEGLRDLFKLFIHRVPGELVSIKVEAITVEDERFAECEESYAKNEVPAAK